MGFLVLIFLIIPAVIFASGYRWGAVNTRVKLSYGNRQINFYTTEKTLAAAVGDQGLKLYPQDRASLPLSTRLTGGTISLSITPSTPIAINDGYHRIVGRSAANDPAQILADSGVKLNPEDKISESLIWDPVATGSAGLLVQIDRAPSYFVAVDGKETTVRSWDNHVAAILAGSKVKINSQDEVSPDPSAILLPGDAVTVTRINEVDLTSTESVPFDTDNTTSTAVAFGQSQVTQAGVNGQLQKVYHVTYKNGVEVSRWLKSTTVTQAVQDKIVARGSITGYINYATIYGSMQTAFYRHGYNGKHLLVTNLSNGKQVTVTVVDYGPTDGGVLDLETDAYAALGGSTGQGHLSSVSVVLLD